MESRSQKFRANRCKKRILRWSGIKKPAEVNQRVASFGQIGVLFDPFASPQKAGDI